jgi:hypothetical protein
MTNKKLPMAFDRARRVWEAQEALMSEFGFPRGNESDVVRAFRECHEAGEYLHAELLPLGPSDTVVYEMAFRWGRADIVIFHEDGTASVIEAKDGRKGYNHVVAGIGQVSLYATQIALKDAVKSVRRGLMWSPTGDFRLDALISIVCERANVIPLPTPSASVVDAIHATVRRIVEFDIQDAMSKAESA